MPPSPLLVTSTSHDAVTPGTGWSLASDILYFPDVLAKSKGSSNPHNVVKATVDALTKMRDAYTVAQNRGVDLNKVFNG